MSNLVEKYQPLPSVSEIIEHLVDTMGVSPDLRAFDSAAIISGALTAFAEKAHTIVTPTTTASVRQDYNRLTKTPYLPEHLQSPEAFEKRHRELLGITAEERIHSELRATVHQNADRSHSEAQKQFEFGLARIGAFMIHQETEQGPFMEAVVRESVFLPPVRDQASTWLQSCDGLSVVLPAKHAGVIHVAPTFSEAYARMAEAQSGGWQNVALINSNHYNAELARQLAKNVANVSLKRIFASHQGISVGVAELRDNMQNNKRTQNGYGAMLMADVGRYPYEEVVAAIDAAPDLLAAGGALIISDLVNLQSNTGTVHDLFNHARQVLDTDPHQITSITDQTDSTVGGRQAIFVKPR